jgi:hypothetical protein
MTPSGTTARGVSSRYIPPIDLRFPALQTRWVVQELRPTKPTKLKDRGKKFEKNELYLLSPFPALRRLPPVFVVNPIPGLIGKPLPGSRGRRC